MLSIKLCIDWSATYTARHPNHCTAHARLCFSPLCWNIIPEYIVLVLYRSSDGPKIKCPCKFSKSSSIRQQNLHKNYLMMCSCTCSRVRVHSWRELCTQCDSQLSGEKVALRLFRSYCKSRMTISCVVFDIFSINFALKETTHHWELMLISIFFCIPYYYFLQIT